MHGAKRWLVRLFGFLLICSLVAGGFGPQGKASAYTATGKFYVTGKTIVDPQGNEFIVKGTNINGYNTAWGGDTLGHLNLVKNVWKFNTVRVYCRIDPAYNGFNKDKQYLYDVIDAYTAAGIVVMPEVHDKKGSYFTSASTPSLADLKAFWSDLAVRYKDNSYVWFNIMNEPGSSNDKPVLSTWDSMHKEVIETIRNAGATNNIIVLDGSSWAQESAAFTTDNVLSSNSAFLTYGTGIKSYNNSLVGNTNVVFSVHFYREWVTRNGITADAKMEDYINRVHANDLALIVGEYGVYTNAETQTATEAMQRVAFPKKVGRIVWHWLGGDDNTLTTSGGGHQIDRTDGVKPTNLTWLGNLVWDDNHATSSGDSTATNLVQNPDFETGTLSSWNVVKAFISGIVHSGTKSVKLGDSAGAASEVTQTIPVSPNSSYTLTAWMKTSVASGVNVTLNASGYGSSSSATDVSGTTWVQRSITFTTSSTASSVTIKVSKPAGTGYGYADDFSLVKN